MSENEKELEERQLKNVRNRLREFINKAAPLTLIKIAIQYGISVPKELVYKYILKREE